MKSNETYNRPIPAKVHGIFDYIGGIALLLAPTLFGFAEVGGAAVFIPRLLGVIVIIQSLLTNFEVGVVKLIPMKMHLTNDYIAAIFLALSPWLFGFSTYPLNVWLPHVVVGCAILAASLLTEEYPRTASSPSHP